MRRLERRDLVGERDERPPLVARAEPAAKTQPEERQHASPRSTLGGHHEPGARVHHAHPGLPRGIGRLLPLLDHVGREARALRSGLVDGDVAGVAVVAHGRGADQHRRCGVEGGDGARDGTGAEAAAVEDLPLVGVGPPVVADPGRSEVDDRVGALERPQVDGAALRVPRDLVRGGSRTAHETHDVVAVGAQRGDQRRPHEAGRAGDRDLHPTIVSRHRAARELEACRSRSSGQPRVVPPAVAGHQRVGGSRAPRARGVRDAPRAGRRAAAA